MNLIYFFISFFIGCLNVVYGQSSCQTPDGGKGDCISILNCSSLLELVNNKNRTAQDIDLLRNSKCGYQGKTPLVCCPACSTPEGLPGRCMSIHSCPHLANMMKQSGSKDKLDFVLKSQYACKGAPEIVCCGPSPNFSGCEARMSSLPPNPESECCGIQLTEAQKIVGYGGEATKIDEHPWVVIIEYMTPQNTTRLLCGGSLISGKYILTAAHCIAGQILKIAKPHTVRLGEYDITHDGPDCDTRFTAANEEDCTEGVTRIQIEKTIPHPEYNPVDPQRRNDIGLIRLKETAPYTDFIRPICLPNKDRTLRQNVLNELLYAVGWGATSFSQPYSPVKVQVELPFADQENCQKAYHTGGRNIDLWKRQLCAGGIKGKDTCKGDSGGPLVYQRYNEQSEVFGIVSFGSTPCGLEGVPGIYTNVYEYLDWIKSTIVP